MRLNTLCLMAIASPGFAQGVRSGLDADGPTYSSAPEWPLYLLSLLFIGAGIRLFLSQRNWLKILTLSMFIGILAGIIFNVVWGFFIWLIAYIFVSHRYEDEDSEG